MDLIPMDVAGVTCPSCAHHSMIVNRDRHLECANVHCERPTAAQEVLSEPMTNRHVMVLNHDGPSVKHPIIERLDDALLHCPLADFLIMNGRRYLANHVVVANVRYYAYYDGEDVVPTLEVAPPGIEEDHAHQEPQG